MSKMNRVELKRDDKTWDVEMGRTRWRRWEEEQRNDCYMK